MTTLNKRSRTMLFWLAVIVFVIVAPLLIAYSQGLRYDFATMKIVRVGAIAIDSNPEDSEIVVDGKFIGERTPEVLRGLIPNRQYKIEVQREGYHWWYKTLTVEPQRITAARGIHLFPSELTFEKVGPERLDVEEMHVNGNGERIFIATSRSEVFVYDVSAATSTPVTFVDGLYSQEINNVLWNDNHEHVIFSRGVSGDTLWYVFDARALSLVNLNEQYASLRDNVKETTLTSLPPFTFDPTDVIFARNGGTRFFVVLEGQVYIINLRDGTINNIGLDDIALVYGSGARFFAVSSAGAVVEFEEDGKIVRTYAELGFVPKKISLSPNGQRLAYSTGRSIEVLWLDKQELDYRRSRGDIDKIFAGDIEIERMWWHASSNYLILARGSGQITVMEIDVRDHQNGYTWNVGEAGAFGYTLRQSRLWTSFFDGSLGYILDEF